MKKPVLGLSLSQNRARAVLIEQNTSSNRLLAAGEWKNTLFDYAGDDTPGVDDFVDHVSRFITAHRTAEPPQVAVAIDTALLFISTIPLASTMSRSEIDSQIEWEIQTHFPDAPAGSFISDFHILTKPRNEDWDEILLVTARLDMVNKLHRAFSRLNFRVAIVDGDHFSADTALRHSHPGAASKFIALVGIKPDRLDVSLSRYMEIESYSYAVVQSEEQCIEEVTRISKEQVGLSSILVYGAANAELVARMQQSCGCPIEMLNPLRLLDIAHEARADEALMNQTSTYAAAIGVGLRRD